MMDVKQIQEGDVIDVPNPFDAPTRSGALVHVYGWVGRWNNGGAAKGQNCPLIVRGVIEKTITTGAAAIGVGDYLALDTATGELTKQVVSDADDADTDEPGNADAIVRFGKSLSRIPANTTRKCWVRIRSQD